MPARTVGAACLTLDVLVGNVDCMFGQDLQNCQYCDYSFLTCHTGVVVSLCVCVRVSQFCLSTNRTLDGVDAELLWLLSRGVLASQL